MFISGQQLCKVDVYIGLIGGTLVTFTEIYFVAGEVGSHSIPTVFTVVVLSAGAYALDVGQQIPALWVFGVILW